MNKHFSKCIEPLTLETLQSRSHRDNRLSQEKHSAPSNEPGQAYQLDRRVSHLKHSTPQLHFVHLGHLKKKNGKMKEVYLFN